MTDRDAGALDPRSAGPDRPDATPSAALHVGDVAGPTVPLTPVDDRVPVDTHRAGAPAIGPHPFVQTPPLLDENPPPLLDDTTVPLPPLPPSVTDPAEPTPPPTDAVADAQPAPTAETRAAAAEGKVPDATTSESTTPEGTTSEGAATEVTASERAVSDGAAAAESSATPDANASTEVSIDGPAPATAGSVARNSSVMAVGSLVSRATGFLRTAAIGAAIGGIGVGTSYQVANTLPNQVYELLLGGILTSVVVPLLVKARKQDPDGGDAYTHRLLTLTAVLLGIATFLAIVAAPLLTLFFVDSGTPDAKRVLITTLAYLLLPEIFFYGLAAVLAAVLNTRNSFAAPMFTPILNNVVVIATAVLFVMLPGPHPPTPNTITGLQVAVLGIGTSLGVLCQAAALWPALRKVGFRWKWRFDLRGSRLGEAGHLAGWMLVYVATSQVGVFVILRLASLNDDRGGPGPFIHNDAFLLFMMVHGIVAVSVITALLPRMSAAAVDGRFGEVAANLSLGTRLCSVVLVPATAAYLVLGVPLAVTAFQWGAFSPGSARDVGLATIAAGIGLVPFAVSQLQIFAFYALRDTKTPALINIPVVVAKVIVAWVLYMVLPPHLTVVGLMTANTVSYLVAVVASAWLLRRRLGRLDSMRILRTLTRLTLAAVVAGAIGWAIGYSLQAWLGTGKLGSFVAVVVGGVALVAAFAAGTVLLRVREVTDLAGSLRTRIPGLR